MTIAEAEAVKNGWPMAIVILDSAGYTGVDAIADRYVILEATSNGTKISVDIDGPQASGQWPVTVTILSGVSPSALTNGDWIFQ